VTINEQRLVERLYECNKHKAKLITAMGMLKSIIPLNKNRYDNLSVEQSGFVDQMIFRFLKLQDAMGEKVFPALLLLLGEEIRSKSFIDRLNRLEELGLLYKNEWMALRKDRNEIAHEYSFNQDEIISGINTIYASTDKLLSVYDNFYDYCLNKFEFVRDSRILADRA